MKDIEAIKTYTAAPLQAGPEREELYRRFQEERTARKAALGEIEKAGRRRYVDWREQWQRKKLEIKRLPMLRQDRQNLWREITQREREELAALRAVTADERKAVREARPGVSWRAFLKSRTGLDQDTQAVNPVEPRPDLGLKTVGPEFNEEGRLQREDRARAEVPPLESARAKANPVERADESPKPAAGIWR